MGTISRYNLRQNIKQRREKEDFFSRLPDEVIISNILSRLKPREAGKCCFISRRWRSLWKQSVSCRLIFTSFWGKGYRFLVRRYGLRRRRGQFVSWVNKILDLPHHRPTIDEFIVHFDLNSRYACDINKWMNFAFRKGVERLELDLTPYHYDFGKDNYVFPGIENLSALCDDSNHGMIINTSYCGSGLHNLKDICFKYVDVDGEALEYILSNCHSLERLSVKRSNTLIELKACGKSIGLKRLKFVDCQNAEKIDIVSSSLVSLKYRGSRAALRLVSVPSLSELCIGGDYCRDFLSRRASNLKCVSQLKKLKLYMNCKVVEECVNYPRKFEKFLSLEQLEVKMKIYNGLFLLWPTILIKAAPALQRFAIKLKYDQERLMSAHSKLTKGKHISVGFDEIVVGPTPGLSQQMKNKIKRAGKKQHDCLKVVEICPFVGNTSDLTLARHLLRMPFQSLEQLVLVTCPCAPVEIDELNVWDPMRQRYRKRSREQANLVRSWLPSSTQLVVL